MKNNSRILLTGALLCFACLAEGQTFNIWTGGVQFIPNDTLEVSASGGSGNYTAGFPMDFQNTGNTPLDLEFLLDDSGILSPAQFAMGCSVGGCYTPGQTAGTLGVVLQPGQTMQLISPVFDCYDPSCWGSHLASITFSEIGGNAVPVTIHLRINIPTGVGMEEHSSGVLDFHPNPASDVVSFRVEQKVTMMLISDLMGRVVYTAFPGAWLDEKVDVGEFENGLYLVSVYTEDSMHSGKLIVQH